MGKINVKKLLSSAERLKRTRKYAESCKGVFLEYISLLEEVLSLGGSPRLRQIVNNALEGVKRNMEFADLLQFLEEQGEEIKMVMEVNFPDTGESYTETIAVPDEKLIEWQNNLTKSITETISLMTEVESLFDIKEVPDPKGGKRRVLVEFKSEEGKVKGRKQGSKNVELPKIVQELVDVSEEVPLNIIRFPTDLVEVQIKSSGDLIKVADEKRRNWIQEKQREGKLLNGTLEGLTGGNAYFHIFLIALAQTLNEQSNKFNKGDYYSGLPKDRVMEVTGLQIEEEKRLPQTYNGETRSFPYVAIILKDFLKKIRGGDSYGGQDIEDLDKYIKELSGKEYMIDRGEYGGIVGLTLFSIFASLYHPETADKYGYILKLSPQFSETIRGYRKMRADTITLLGGGKQKDITMKLLDYLIYVMNSPQKGRKTGEFGVNKEKLMERIAKGKKYQTRKKDRETDFQTAVQKMKNIKLLHPTKGFREEISPSRETICVFYFNPDYLKGEEYIEDQTPQE